MLLIGPEGKQGDYLSMTKLPPHGHVGPVYALQLTMAGQSSLWSCASRLEQTSSKFTSGGHVYNPALCVELFANGESGFDDCLDLTAC